MNVDVAPRQSRWSRLLLIAGAIGLVWCAVSVLGQSSTASAAEDDGNGALRTLTSAVEQTTVTSANDSVEPVVNDVIGTAAPAAPAPTLASTAALNVVPGVQQAADVAATTVSPVTATTNTALGGTAATVDPVAEVGASTAAATTKLAFRLFVERGHAPLLKTITSLPIDANGTDELGLAAAVASILRSTDDIIAAIAGTSATVIGDVIHPTLGGIPSPPGTSPPGESDSSAAAPTTSGNAEALTVELSLVFGGFFAGALALGAAPPSLSASSNGSNRWGGMPFDPSSFLSGGSAAIAALSAVLIEFSWRARLRGGAAPSLSDDALPGAPVFATDVSPD